MHDTCHVDTQHAANNSNMTADGGSSNEDYAQNGTTTHTTLNIRTAPSTSAAVAGSYAPGESLNYDHVYIKEGYAWARYMSYSGQYYYVAMGKMAEKNTEHIRHIQAGLTPYIQMTH